MQMLNSHIKDIFHKILVIDIETVSMVADYKELPENMQQQWDRKAAIIQKYNEPSASNVSLFQDKAGIYAEFGKVVCISMGYFSLNDEKLELRIKTIAADNEEKLLKDFLKLIYPFEKKNKSILFCGHNIKEFDLPYLCRRMMIHQMKLPTSLQLSGVKPWNNPHLDTLELWRFGDYKHFVSLDLLAAIFGVTSSKEDMDGSMVGNAYWNKKRLNDIANYCSRDVATTAKVFLKMNGEEVSVDVVNVD